LGEIRFRRQSKSSFRIVIPETLNKKNPAFEQDFLLFFFCLETKEAKIQGFASSAVKTFFNPK
jgi:hypothetical protein